MKPHTEEELKENIQRRIFVITKCFFISMLVCLKIQDMCICAQGHCLLHLLLS